MDQRWRIVIGSDSSGASFSQAIKALLEDDQRVGEVTDIRLRCDQSAPDHVVAIAAARELTSGRADRALLMCRAGLGLAMSANRVPGIRAVTASDSFAVQRSVLEWDAQVLCLGHEIISLDVAKRLTREWLGYRFSRTAAPNVAVLSIYRNKPAAERRSRSPQNPAQTPSRDTG